MRLEELPLGDFHTLRAIWRKLGRVAERECKIECSNCRAKFSAAPCSGLELGPYRDDELDDAELDAVFDFELSHDVPALFGGATPSRVRLEPRTVGEAAPLHVAIHASRPLRISADVVRGMGIAEIDGVTSARKLARMLMSAPDAAFDAVANLFEDAHYPRRLEVPHRCPECGVAEWLSVPRRASSPWRATSECRSSGATSWAWTSSNTWYARRQRSSGAIPTIVLAVIEDAAEVDDAGEPLLGCYQPPDPDALVPAPAEIRRFYRTFLTCGPTREATTCAPRYSKRCATSSSTTADFLPGDDPLDDAEQQQLKHEHLRRVGRSEAEKRAARELFGGAREFVARTWPLWTVVLIATLAAIWASR